MRRHRSPLVTTIVVVVVAISGSAFAAAPSAAAAITTAGCSGSPSPGTSTLTPKFGGRTRTVIVHVPPKYTGRTPVPLVLNLHGSESSAHSQELFTGMDATADADTFIVAYPQAAIARGAGFDWNVPHQPLLGARPAPKHAPNDVAFLTRLVSTLERVYCISRKRVDATGFSGGGRMASQLGCDAASTFAAVAPVSGLRFPAPCSSSRAVPVLAIHGTADPVDPYRGNGQPYWTYSVPVAAQRWARHDRCAPSPVTTTPASAITVATYSRCSTGATVELYTISGAGHVWPSGPHLGRRITRVLGTQTNAVNADDVIAAFFAAHPAR